jgi:lipopolysaccharide export system protein LptA
MSFGFLSRRPLLATGAFFLIVALAVGPRAPLEAQGLGGLQNADGPLTIDADEGIEWQRDRQVYIARGNAVATRGNITVAADELVAHYREDTAGETDIYQIDAIGSVVITSPTERITGDKGVYYADRGMMRMTGESLRYETAEDVVTARDSLEYWEDFDGGPIAVARGDAVAERKTKEERIAAEVLTASLAPDADGKLAVVRLDGEGDVEVSTPIDYARGNEGVYYVKEERAELNGDVKITRGENQLNGERAEVNMKTGVSRLLPGEGGRVRGLIIPQKSAAEPNSQ